MLNWQPGPTGGLVAQTPFCYCMIYRQQGRRERYTARIEGQNRGVLAINNDLPSEEVAQAWAEQEYKVLLQAELARVE